MSSLFLKINNNVNYIKNLQHKFYKLICHQTIKFLMDLFLTEENLNASYSHHKMEIELNIITKILKL
jgi:hypothetical protein